MKWAMEGRSIWNSSSQIERLLTAHLLTPKTRTVVIATVRAFRFFEGSPRPLTPDNLKTAVNKASRYEPELNHSYLELPERYGCIVLPARPHKPKDKAKVEAGVQLMQRWILASESACRTDP
jgi:transposase